jgi:4-amino-4-deoxy-L-arabinose transferase-like glycosyltransferase
VKALSTSRATNSSRAFAWKLLFVFLLALGVRLGYWNVARAGSLGNPDSAEYQALAETVKEHRPYQTSVGQVKGFPTDLLRPPIYPAFIAWSDPLPGVSRMRTALLQCFLGAGFATLLALLVARGVSTRAGLWAGVFYALDWATVLHTPMLIAETLYTVVLAVAVLTYAAYLMQRKTWFAVLAGALLGTAALVKPAAQVLVLALLIAWMFAPPRRVAGLAFLLSYALVVGPWMLRNYQQHRVFTVSAITSVNLLYIGKNALDDQSWQKYERTYDARVNASEVARRAQQRNQEAVQLIGRNWPHIVQQCAVGLVRACVGTGTETLKDSLPPRFYPGPLLRTVFPLVQVLLLWAFTMVGLVIAWREKTLPRAVVILLVVSVLAILLPAANMSYSRFRVPAVPMLCLFAGVGAAYLHGRSERQKNTGEVATVTA